MSTHLETVDGSLKFWEIDIEDAKTIITQGKIGKEGTKTEKEHSSKEAAKKYAETQIANKKSRGFSSIESKEEETEAPAKKRKTELAPKKTQAKGKKAATKSKKDDDNEEEESEEEKEEKEKVEKKTKGKKAAPKKQVKQNKNKNIVEKTPTPAPVVSTFAPVAPEPTTRGLAADSPPIVWESRMGHCSAFGVYVNDSHVYSGDDSGLIQQFDRDGKLQKQFRVPSYPAGVKVIIGDGPFVYAGCNDGSIFDITQDAPRFTCNVETFKQVYSLDIHNGIIAAADATGNVALVNAEGETIWVKKNEIGSAGWMCIKDDTGVYHGHTNGVTKRSLETGEVLWTAIPGKSVMFGQQDDKHIYASCGMGIYKLDKSTGAEISLFSSGGPSCAISKDGNQVISSLMKVYDNTGKMLEEFNNAPASMVALGEHEVYSVRDVLVKYDFSPEAIQKVKDGKATAQCYQFYNIPEVQPTNTVTEVVDPTDGILCECVKEDGKLRIRVIAGSYNKEWNVQFPRAIREEGAKYVVEKIISQNGFYQAWGDIRKVKSN